MSKLATQILAGLLMLVASSAYAEDIYRWVDAEGVVNYTERKPKGVESQLVRRSGRSDKVAGVAPITADASGNQTTTADSNLNSDQQAMLDDLKTSEAKRQEDIAKIKQDNCGRARAVLERLTKIGRVRVRGEDGTERALPEDERQARIDEAQKGIAANCTS